jgi:centromere protein C
MRSGFRHLNLSLLGTVEINQDRDDAEDSFDEQSGLRRGRRTRYRPLDWWRLERVEYGPGKHLAEVKKIITLPKEPPKPLGGKRRAGSRKPASRAKSRAKSRASDDENDVDPDVLEQARMERWNPEEGWDKDTKADCSVYDTVAKMDVIRSE